MSLTLTFDTALSGLTVSQAALSNISQNVANANTVGYSRQILGLQQRIVAGQANGVEIAGITRVIDTFLVRELQAQRSALGETKAAESFFNEIQARFGTTGSDSTIPTDLAEFASALDTLATNPEDAALRFDAVASGIALARNISKLASDVQSLRAEADKEIKAAVDTINTQLRTIDALNVAISRARAGGATTVALEDQRDRAVSAIAENIGITTFERDNGELSVLSSGGETLLDTQLRELDYTPNAAVTSTSVFGAITIFTIDSVTGERVGSSDVLVTSGTSDAVVNNVKSGRLKGLLDIRDNTLDGLADQIDTLATEVRRTFNATHNTGVAFPPPNALTGTRTVNGADSFTGTGTVRIAVVDANGAIVGTPLDLDLTATGATTVGALATTINTALGADGSAAVVNGKLQITAANAANGIAINENDSQVSGTTQAFSDFFGLNDLFIGTGSSDFAVRADIVTNPAFLATGFLSLTATSGQTAVTSGDNRVMQQLAGLTEARITFSAVGGLSGGSFTLGEYAGSILGLNAVQASEASDDARLSQDLFDNLENRATSLSGVNIDEEMASMIVFQTSFAASARVMRTAAEMLKMLIDLAA